MAGLLLAERAPADARILVLGAGGGLELKHLSELYSGWTFDGVDPSAEMLKLAERTLGPLGARTRLRQGYIDDAPPGPFDGAACLLTLHFIPEDERRRTLSQMHRRLRPGAPCVVAHHSFPQGTGKATWLKRYAAFAVSSGVPAADAERAIAAIDERLPVLSPERDAALLEEAGFGNVELFYAAFSFRGWVATA
ncbi:MAG: methyltransferase [Phenylobacterium sp.]|nr:methyltransferase [Phenylobacterium sp.]